MPPANMVTQFQEIATQILGLLTHLIKVLFLLIQVGDFENCSSLVSELNAELQRQRDMLQSLTARVEDHLHRGPSNRSPNRKEKGGSSSAQQDGHSNSEASRTLPARRLMDVPFDDLTSLDLQVWGKDVITWGTKHKNAQFDEVNRLDWQYYQWIRDRSWPEGSNQRSFIRYCQAMIHHSGSTAADSI